MDQEELRLSCLRMAYELGGKTEAIISAANDLMNFVTKGPSADAGAAALEPAGAPNEVSAPAAEPVVTDRIAACGTALEMPESGDLAHAEPVIEVKAATEAEPAAAAEETEAVPSEAAEEVATITAPTAEVEATALVEPSPGPIEPPVEATNGGSAGPAVAPEVEAATVAAAPAASASEVVAPSSEEHASAAAPLTDGSGQEHTAN